MDQTIEELATEAADQAVNNLQPNDQALYRGEHDHDAIYSLCGLRNQIIEEYYNCYSHKKPTTSLFEDIAHDCVL